MYILPGIFFSSCFLLLLLPLLFFSTVICLHSSLLYFFIFFFSSLFFLFPYFLFKFLSLHFQLFFLVFIQASIVYPEYYSFNIFFFFYYSFPLPTWSLIFAVKVRLRREEGSRCVQLQTNSHFVCHSTIIINPALLAGIQGSVWEYTHILILLVYNVFMYVCEYTCSNSFSRKKDRKKNGI